MKGELLEGGLRIPAIVRWPRRIASVVSEQVMISMDWMPTLLAAAGTQMDPAYPPDGDNLLPILSGRASPHPRKLFMALQGRLAAPCATAIGNICRSPATNSCSTWSRTRASGPISRSLQGRFRSPQERLGGLERHDAGRASAAGLQQSGNVVADHYGVVSPPPAAPPGAPRSDDRLVATTASYLCVGVRAARRSGQAQTIRPPGASHSWTQ